MMKQDFTINPVKKTIRYNSDGSGKTYSIKEFYSYIMDIFDDPDYMRYDIPIEAVSQPKADQPLAGKTKYKLINGWSVDKKATKHLRENLISQ